MSLFHLVGFRSDLGMEKCKPLATSALVANAGLRHGRAVAGAQKPHITGSNRANPAGVCSRAAYFPRSADSAHRRRPIMQRLRGPGLQTGCKWLVWRAATPAWGVGMRGALSARWKASPDQMPETLINLSTSKPEARYPSAKVLRHAVMVFFFLFLLHVAVKQYAAK